MTLIAAFLGGPTEIIVVLAILLLLFGSTKLPKLARGLGSSVTEFRKGLRGEGDDDEDKDKKKVGSGEDAETDGDDQPRADG